MRAILTVLPYLLLYLLLAAGCFYMGYKTLDSSKETVFSDGQVIEEIMQRHLAEMNQAIKRLEERNARLEEIISTHSEWADADLPFDFNDLRMHKNGSSKGILPAPTEFSAGHTSTREEYKNPR